MQNLYFEEQNPENKFIIQSNDTVIQWCFNATFTWINLNNLLFIIVRVRVSIWIYIISLLEIELF